MINFLKKIKQKVEHNPAPKLAALIDKDDITTATYLNAHSLVLAFYNKQFRLNLAKMNLLYADGWMAVLALKLLGLDFHRRSTAPDFFDFFSEFVAGKRIFLLGGKKSQLNKVVNNLKRKKVSFSAVASYHGYFKDNKQVISAINQFKPNIILVGMGAKHTYGMPRQERWVIENKSKIKSPCLLWCVGGFFNYYPRCKGHFFNYFEWLSRAVQEPFRLGVRYFFDGFNIILVLGYIGFIRLLFKIGLIK